jgi:hypothetical protein
MVALSKPLGLLHHWNWLWVKQTARLLRQQPWPGANRKSAGHSDVASGGAGKVSHTTSAISAAGCRVPALRPVAGHAHQHALGVAVGEASQYRGAPGWQGHGQLLADFAQQGLLVSPASARLPPGM